MPRLMSFAATVPQFEARIKDMTRRLGWEDLEPGDLIEGTEWNPRVGVRWACAATPVCGWTGSTKEERVPEGGRCPGCGGLVERRRPRRLGLRRVVRSWRESLDEIRAEHVAREGYPNMEREQFIRRFCKMNRCDPWQDVTVITFRGVDRGIGHERTEYAPPWHMCACRTCQDLALEHRKAGLTGEDRPKGPPCEYRNLERLFAEAWEKENDPKAWINSGFGALVDLCGERRRHVDGFARDGFDPTDRERVVAATVIQWLGSNCGWVFLTEVLRKAGYRIERVEKTS